MLNQTTVPKDLKNSRKYTEIQGEEDVLLCNVSMYQLVQFFPALEEV